MWCHSGFENSQLFFIIGLYKEDYCLVWLHSEKIESLHKMKSDYQKVSAKSNLSAISWWEQVTFDEMMNDVCFVPDHTLNWIFIVLAHWNKTPWIYMSLHSKHINLMDIHVTPLWHINLMDIHVTPL
jgi:hypothetical protein